MKDEVDASNDSGIGKDMDEFDAMKKCHFFTSKWNWYLKKKSDGVVQELSEIKRLMFGRSPSDGSHEIQHEQDQWSIVNI